MKRLATTLGLSLGLIGAAALGGCAATTAGGPKPEQSVQFVQDAQVARRLMADHCIVGRVIQGWPRIPVYLRQGVVNLRTDATYLIYRHRLVANEITVYSVRDLPDGWVAVDASTRQVRENFYFNRKSGAFACSENEWYAGGGSGKTSPFERAPLPGASMNRVE